MVAERDYSFAITYNTKNNIEWNKYNRYDSFEFLFTNKIPNYMDVKAFKCEKNIIYIFSSNIFNVFLF